MFTYHDKKDGKEAVVGKTTLSYSLYSENLTIAVMIYNLVSYLHCSDIMLATQLMGIIIRQLHVCVHFSFIQSMSGHHTMNRAAFVCLSVCLFPISSEVL